MNIYLEKIAEAKSKKKDKRKYHIGETFVKAFVPSTIIGGAAGVANKALHNKMNKEMDRGSNKYSKKELSAYKKSMKEDKLVGKVTSISGNSEAGSRRADKIITPVKSRTRLPFANATLGKNYRKAVSRLRQINAGALNVTVGHSPMYIPKTKGISRKGVISGGGNGDIGALLHEQGHAKLHNKKYIGKAMTRARGMSSNVGGVAALGIYSKNQKTRDRSQAVALASQLPTLADEGYANTHALRKMKKHLGKKKMLKAVPGLAAAMGTYVTSAAAKGGALHVTKKIADKVYTKHQKKGN